MEENSNKICTCKSINCSRYGKCKECIEHHKTHSNNKLPHCQRPGNKEVADKVSKFAHIIC